MLDSNLLTDRMSLIPNLDLSHWTSGSSADKKAFAADLGKAYTDIGFVTIKNHGFSDAMQTQLYEEVDAFFALDTDTKKKYELEKLAGQRGYTSFGREHAKGIEAADLKEFWQVGQPSPAYNGPEYHNNISVSAEVSLLRTPGSRRMTASEITAAASSPPLKT